MRPDDIAIIGMECIFPGADCATKYWDNLASGRDCVSDVPEGRMNGGRNFGLPASNPVHLPCTKGGFIPNDIGFDPIRFGIMPSIVKQGDPDQFLLLQVLDRALSDAAVREDDPIRARTDVVIGRGGYLSNKMGEMYVRAEVMENLFEFLRVQMPDLSARHRTQLEEALRSTLPVSEADSVSTCIPNITASRAANRLNLGGAAFNIDAACASSLVAIEQITTRLRTRQCDLGIAGGMHLFQIPGFWFVFTQLGALSTSNSIRPFDRRADGLVIGEGIGAVVMKRLQDAQRDGDRIYAVIRGVGLSSDGRDTSVLTPSPRGQMEAMRRAYADAQLSPDSIGYLEAHGTGTIAGDMAEIHSMRGIFGSRGKWAPLRPFGSVKSMIGHLMPAAGIASIIKVALMLNNKHLPPSLHCEEPRSELRDLAFYVNTEIRPWIHSPKLGPRRAAVNAFGFGGINAHVILEEVEPAGPTSVSIPRSLDTGLSRPTELLLLSAHSAAELQEKSREVAAQLQSDSLGDVAAGLLESIRHEHRCKLALVASTASSARDLLNKIDSRLSQSEPSFADLREVYFSANAAKPLGKVAGIFPGIGFPGLIGNYPDHLLELCRYFPEVREIFDSVEARDHHPEDPYSTSYILCPPTSLPDATRLNLRNRVAAMKVIESEDVSQVTIEPWERNIAASAVTVSNWVSWRLLQELKVPVDMVCGQSQGEMAALCAAGVLDLEEVIPRFWQALAISPSYAGKGRLAFVGTSEAQIAPLLQEGQYSTVAVAIHVAPTMLVLGGEDDELRQFTDRLRATGVICQLLPYPPIHTPQLSHMRDELMQVVDTDVHFGEPHLTVYSAVTEAPYPKNADEVREIALRNLDQPVRFWQTIHRMYEAGARVFLQVGGGSLAANIATILPEPGIVGTAVDVDYRSPYTQLQHLCATLFVSGVEFDPAFLFRHRSLHTTGGTTYHSKSSSAGIPLRMDWTPFDAKFAKPIAAAADLEVGTTVPADSPGSPQFQSASTAATNQVSESSDQPTPNSLPFVDDVLEYVPDERIVVRRVLDLHRDHFLRDHAFICPSQSKPLESLMPVLPMTMILEACAETATYLAPGLGLIGFEKARAQRWIAFTDKLTVELVLKAKLQSVDDHGTRRIEVEINCDGQPSSAVVVLFDSVYRQDLQLTLCDLDATRTWPLTAEEIYSERHLFHGPMFQCVSNLGVYEERGFTAEITMPQNDELFKNNPTPLMLVDPVALDGVAQLIGMWATVLGYYSLPSSIAKIEIYRPPPAPGTRVFVHAEIELMDPEQRLMIGNIQVVDELGELWFSASGWKQWLFCYSQQLLDAQRLPWRYHLSDEINVEGVPYGSVITAVSRTHVRQAVLDWLARLFLHHEEMPRYDQYARMLRRQWQWTMGRIAAKDAARLYLARETQMEMIHPADLVVNNDEFGRPEVAPMVEVQGMPNISLAHTDDWAVAMACPFPCGIDVEKADRVGEEVFQRIVRDEERSLVDELIAADPVGSWPTRIWCAKEAAAKAVGTGLNGRFGDFVILDVESDGSVLVRVEPTSQTLFVRTVRFEDLVMAYTYQEKGVHEQDTPAVSSHLGAPK